MIANNTALTSGYTEYDKGFEYYTFEVAFSGFEALSKASDPMHILTGWYTQDPRPAASEVVGISETKLNMVEKLVVITLKIMRGHYFIGDFVWKHMDHHIENTVDYEEGLVGLECLDCKDKVVVYGSSIPQYKGKARNAQTYEPVNPSPVGV